MCVCVSECLSVCLYVTIVTLRNKTKTKRDKNYFFAGIVDYVKSNFFLSKSDTPILISSEVIGVKNRDMNYLTPHKTETKKDKKLNFAGVVDYLTIYILSKFERHIFIYKFV